MAGYILAELKVTNQTLCERYRDALLPLVEGMGGACGSMPRPRCSKAIPGRGALLDGV